MNDRERKETNEGKKMTIGESMKVRLIKSNEDIKNKKR